MEKFLNYEGLSKYNSLIVALIKSGDSELLEMINDIKDVVEGSEAGSVDAKLAELEELLNGKIEALGTDTEGIDERLTAVEESIDGKISAAVAGVIDGAPEAYDTLKEIADWIASGEAGVAELISKVSANETAIATNKASIEGDIEALSQHVEAASTSYAEHDERISNIETIIGADGGSESIMDKIDSIESELPIAITNDEIDALFVTE